jgi:hypothetical protein
MLLKPRLLATALIDASDGRLTDGMQEALAVALAKGGGIAISGLKVCVVLRNPLLACPPGQSPFLPTLVVGDRPVTETQREFRTTSQVAAFIVTRTKPGKRPYGKPTYAPAALPGLIVPLSGPHLGQTESIEVKNRGKDTVVWHNLNDIPEGSFVYTVNESGEIALCQRVGPDHWILLALDGKQDATNMARALHRVSTVHGLRIKVKGIEDLDGPPTLLRAPVPTP